MGALEVLNSFSVAVRFAFSFKHEGNIRFMHRIRKNGKNLDYRKQCTCNITHVFVGSYTQCIVNCKRFAHMRGLEKQVKPKHPELSTINPNRIETKQRINQTEKKLSLSLLSNTHFYVFCGSERIRWIEIWRKTEQTRTYNEHSCCCCCCCCSECAFLQTSMHLHSMLILPVITMLSVYSVSVCMHISTAKQLRKVLTMGIIAEAWTAFAFAIASPKS